MQKIERAADVGGKQAGDQAEAGDVFFLIGILARYHGSGDTDDSIDDVGFCKE